MHGLPKIPLKYAAAFPVCDSAFANFLWQDVEDIFFVLFYYVTTDNTILLQYPSLALDLKSAMSTLTFM